MALPSLGNQISLSDIRAELQNTGKSSNVSLRYIGGYEDASYVPANQSSTSKPDLVAPYAISEWASYNHSESKLCSINTITGPTLSSGRVYHKITATGNVGDVAEITFYGLDNNVSYSSQIDLYLNYPFDNNGNIIESSVYTVVGGSTNYEDVFYHYLQTTSDVLYIVVKRI